MEDIFGKAQGALTKELCASTVTGSFLSRGMGVQTCAVAGQATSAWWTCSCSSGATPSITAQDLVSASPLPCVDKL